MINVEALRIDVQSRHVKSRFEPKRVPSSVKELVCTRFARDPTLGDTPYGMNACLRGITTRTESNGSRVVVGCVGFLSRVSWWLKSRLVSSLRKFRSFSGVLGCFQVCVHFTYAMFGLFERGPDGFSRSVRFFTQFRTRVSDKKLACPGLIKGGEKFGCLIPVFILHCSVLDFSVSSQYFYQTPCPTIFQFNQTFLTFSGQDPVFTS